MKGDGENAFVDSQDKQLINEKEMRFTKIRGFRESEIEDLINVNCYKEKIRNKYGISLEGNVFKNNRKKWADRIKETCNSCGK